MCSLKDDLVKLACFKSSNPYAIPYLNEGWSLTIFSLVISLYGTITLSQPHKAANTFK